jgi:hypothetical protein
MVAVALVTVVASYPSFAISLIIIFRGAILGIALVKLLVISIVELVLAVVTVP